MGLVVPLSIASSGGDGLYCTSLDLDLRGGQKPVILETMTLLKRPVSRRRGQESHIGMCAAAQAVYSGTT